MSKTAGLLLAAGASSRMGRPKQLLPIGKQCLLDRALQAALGSRLDMVVLIVGHQAATITSRLQTDLSNPRLTIIENKDYKDGISTSIRAGLTAAEDACDNVMIILADMPHVSPEVIDRLLDQYRASGLPLGAVSAAGGRSHPVIISREYYHRVHDLKGDVGARKIFSENRDRVCLVAPGGEYDDQDIDTMEDYRRFKETHGDS